MSQTERYTGPTGYPLVAGVRGQEVLLYQQFGSYQGEWMMLARDPETFFVYKDCYGSCSGCDSYQGADFRDWGDDREGIPMDKALEFAEDYKPFIEIPKATRKIDPVECRDWARACGMTPRGFWYRFELRFDRDP